jgi:FMN phosphatase YigB (HAD superfamily)
MIEQRLGVGRFVRWTFVSCKTGLRKPDARVFVHATRALGVVPGDAVFVDDRADNCDAARAAGLAAVRFQDADQVRAELEGLGLPSRVFR